MFIGGDRLDAQTIWNEYTVHKQTYAQLSQRYSVSVRTIQRYIDKISFEQRSIPNFGHCVVLMDTTYFGDFGLMLFKDAPTGLNLCWRFVKHERLADYQSGIAEIRAAGNVVDAIVCDGFRGLFSAFDGIPIQMCQFHQAAIVRRYLTSRPKLEASKELREIVQLMICTDKPSFVGALSEWYDRWVDFLNERSISPLSGKSRYVHKRLRSAYRSLDHNKHWLFTWYDNLGFGIPSTNNKLEGYFTALKNNLRNHNGLNADRRKLVISELLQASALKIKGSKPL